MSANHCIPEWRFTKRLHSSSPRAPSLPRHWKSSLSPPPCLPSRSLRWWSCPLRKLMVKVINPVLLASFASFTASALTFAFAFANSFFASLPRFFSSASTFFIKEKVALVRSRRISSTSSKVVVLKVGMLASASSLANISSINSAATTGCCSSLDYSEWSYPDFAFEPSVCFFGGILVEAHKKNKWRNHKWYLEPKIASSWGYGLSHLKCVDVIVQLLWRLTGKFSRMSCFED